MSTSSPGPLEPVFDWYQGSVSTGVRDVFGVLEPMTAEEPFHEEKPKLKGYAFASKLGGPGGSVLIHYGGRNGDEHGPNVCATGPLSPKVADLLRGAQVPHGLGRVDVRVDFLGDYAACRLALIERCNQAGMAPLDAGSCPEALKQCGRSVYTGKRGSFLLSTLYQKGIQLGDGHPTDYLRLEHRFVPQKAHEKLEVACLTPAQMIGLRPLSRDLTVTITKMAVRPYKLDRFPKERNAKFWMLTQYRSLLQELLNDHGSPAAVGQQLYEDLKELDNAY